MIEVSGLTKNFGAVRALDDVTFQARDGRITGLLGPNGAGKSTCLRILSTVMNPDRGTATIGGTNVVEHPLQARREFGVLPHSAGLYKQFTARENIAYYGRLHGMSDERLQHRLDELTRRLGLEEIADRKAKAFSQGERTKVALARALVHEPKYLLLDEPTNGLDVIATRDLRSWLIELKNQGCCILLSSHLMLDIAALADDLLIIVHGKLAATGTPESLSERFANDDLEDIFVQVVNEAAQ